MVRTKRVKSKATAGTEGARRATGVRAVGAASGGGASGAGAALERGTKAGRGAATAAGRICGCAVA